MCATHDSTMMKFADDTALVRLISKNDEQAYLEEVENLTQWCQLTNLSLNVGKMKELVVNFRKVRKRSCTTLSQQDPCEEVTQTTACSQFCAQVNATTA